IVITILGTGLASLGLVAMPESADMPDIAEDVLLGRYFQRIRVEVAVVTLVANCQQVSGLSRRAGHAFAIRDGLRHELLAQNMLTLFDRFDRGWRVQMKRQGDNHHLNVAPIQ